MPKYADDARQRVQSKLKTFSNIISQAKQRNVNEADTRDIVKAILGEILGYDPFFEVTGEFSIKGQYADFAVKITDDIKFFVEVKAIDIKLDEKHLFQVIGYAANHGVEWAVLTNGDIWKVFRLFAGDDKKTELCCEFAISTSKSAELVESFFLLSKEGFRLGALNTHWHNVQSLSPKRMAALLCSDSVITQLRREVIREGKVRIDDDGVRDIVLNQLLRGDLSDWIKSQSKSPKAK